MYLSLLIYLHIYFSKEMCTAFYTLLSIYMYTILSFSLCEYIYISTNFCTVLYVCISISLYIYIYIFTYIYILYIYIYIYPYICLSREMCIAFYIGKRLYFRIDIYFLRSHVCERKKQRVRAREHVQYYPRLRAWVTERKKERARVKNRENERETKKHCKGQKVKGKEKDQRKEDKEWKFTCVRLGVGGWVGAIWEEREIQRPRAPSWVLPRRSVAYYCIERHKLCISPCVSFDISVCIRMCVCVCVGVPCHFSYRWWWWWHYMCVAVCCAECCSLCGVLQYLRCLVHVLQCLAVALPVWICRSVCVCVS